MKLDRFRWTIVIVAVLIAGSAWTVASRVPASQVASLLGRRSSAPPVFSARTLDGGMFSLEGQRGKPVIVNFWATWCAPCRAELPAFEAVHRAHAGSDVVIVGVNVAEPQDVVAKFVADMGLTFPIALDPSGEVGELYRVQGLPTTIFISPEGTIRDTVIGGPLTQSAIESKLVDMK